MNKPATLELCERLENCANWLEMKAHEWKYVFDNRSISIMNEWAADIRSIIIPLPTDENEAKSKT